MSFSLHDQRAQIYQYSSSIDSTGTTNSVYVFLGEYWCGFTQTTGQQVTVGLGAESHIDAAITFAPYVSIPLNSLVTVDGLDYKTITVLNRRLTNDQIVYGKLMNNAEYVKYMTGSISYPTASVVSALVSASYAGTASLLLGSIVSSSYALTASYAMNGGGSGPSVSSSYALTASFASTVPSGALSAVLSASYANSASAATSITFPIISASYATNAGSANTSTSASYAVSSSAATSITFPIVSASYATNAGSSNTATSSSFATTSSAATSITFVPATASYSLTSLSASWAPGSPTTSASYATNAGSAQNAKYAPNGFAITGSLNVSGNIDLTAGDPLSAGNSITASGLLIIGGDTTFANVFADSFTGDGSSITGVISSSYAITSSHATTSSAATSITFPIVSASYSDNALNANSALTASFGNNLYVSSALNVSGNITIAQNNTSLVFTDVQGTHIPRFVLQNDNNFVFYNTAPNGSQQAIWSSFAKGASGLSALSFLVPTFHNSNMNVIGSASFNQVTSSQGFSGSIASASFASSSYTTLTASAATSITFVPVTSSYAITSSYATTAQNVLGSITSASYASTASLLLGSVSTASLALTVVSGALSAVLSSSYALTSSYASQASTSVALSNGGSSGYIITGSVNINGAVTASAYKGNNAVTAYVCVNSSSASSLSIGQSFGIQDVKHAATGTLEVHFSVPFSNNLYCATATVDNSQGTLAVANVRHVVIHSGSKSTTTCSFDCYDSTATTNVLKDPNTWNCVFFGI